MRTFADYLSGYAQYHRDPRNVATHFVGIPLIVVAVTTLLARPRISLMGLSLTPAIVLAVFSCLFYLRLDIRFGLVMAAVVAAFVAIGAWIGSLSTMIWLGAGVGLFVAGWVIQLIGHHFEGRKPAFIDDLSGLIIGPLFLVVESCFALGIGGRSHPVLFEVMKGLRPR